MLPIRWVSSSVRPEWSQQRLQNRASHLALGPGPRHRLSCRDPLRSGPIGQRHPHAVPIGAS